MNVLASDNIHSLLSMRPPLDAAVPPVPEQEFSTCPSFLCSTSRDLTIKHKLMDDQKEVFW